MDNECGHESGSCDMQCQLQWYRRRFFTKTEKIEKLENYAEELKKELKAVEERIKEVKR